MNRQFPGILAMIGVVLLCSIRHASAALPDLTIYGPATFPVVIYRSFASNDCTVNEGCVLPGTRKLLVFITESRNVGTADLILGNPSTNSLFVYDPCHNHYHFIGFAEYRLLDTNSSLVVLGRKIGFCLEDVRPWDSNVPTNRIYDCNYQGIQKGWTDIYQDVPCQWIDVTGIASGNYILEMEINPNRSLVESDYSNNITRVPVFIPEDCLPGPNDAFTNAAVITLTPSSFTTYNACATKEDGEPSHAGNDGGRSVWYKGTAASSAVVRVSTEGSDFDTLLAVYTGNAVSSLTLVASNDDIGFPTNEQSALSFSAASGTVYYIAVDGYAVNDHDAAFGKVVLNINPPLNDAFANCQNLTGTIGQTNGYSIGATKQPGEPDHNGDFGGHSVWYCWTAPASGTESFDTIGSNFDTLLAVYTGSAVNALTKVASDNDGGGNLTSRLAFDAIAGQAYHVAVDGAAAATGNLILHWSPTSRLSVHKLSSTSYAVTLAGGPGTFSIQWSADLAHWTNLTTMSVSGSTQQYNDNGSFLRRFYRAVRSP